MVVNFVRFIAAIFLSALILAGILYGIYLFAQFTGVMGASGLFGSYAPIVRSFIFELAKATLVLVAPAIIVACFRYQYSKWARTKAAMTGFGIAMIGFVVWFAILFTMLHLNESLFFSVQLQIEIFTFSFLTFVSGFATSRLVPVLDQRPLQRRPGTILIFEGVCYFMLIAGLLHLAFRYPDILSLSRKLNSSNHTSPFVITPVLAFQFLGFNVNIWFVILIGRFGSVMARNSYIVYVAVGFVFISYMTVINLGRDAFLYTLTDYLLTFGGFAGSFIGIGLLLTPSARKWINRERDDMAPQPA
ncbi:hypothetical protein GQF03_00400 [Sneathiella chungangensis]|uniref:Uncharacterized protein n=1 Tax=Sneathiella chungangensis TaxID=1418234 RepID=A0A845MBI3_9PROT|nr:hypothetical protein [Sneathiella chungangensis]MZR20786.1 hypothetical protein [Sneathiella chungangensis]